MYRITTSRYAEAGDADISVTVYQKSLLLAATAGVLLGVKTGMPRRPASGVSRSSIVSSRLGVGIGAEVEAEVEAATSGVCV